MKRLFAAVLATGITLSAGSFALASNFLGEIEPVAQDGIQIALNTK